MTPLLLLAALLAQAAPRTGAEQQLAEAHRLRELALHDRAEEIIRTLLKTAPHDSQSRPQVPEYRKSLCEVLLAARKYDELKIEAEILRRQVQTRIVGLSFLAAGAWHSGHVAEAAAHIADVERMSDGDVAWRADGPAERRLRMIRGLLDWKRFESETHIIHYPANSTIAANPAAFGRRLDVAFDRVRSELDLQPGLKLEAFFFNDQSQADAIVERTLVTALPAPRQYLSRPDAPPGFAIAQVLSFFVANKRDQRPPRLAGLCDGFYAGHADDARWELRRDEIPRALAAEGSLPPLHEILAEPGRDAKAFALRGAFVRWLIRARGRELFRRLWADYNELAATDLRKPWIEIYGAPLEDLEAAWRSSIK